SYSLQGRDYDFRDHPLLYDYCRGVMASPYTINDLRSDLDLLAEFPPKELPGLDERCRWRPLENRASRMMEGINGGLGRGDLRDLAADIFQPHLIRTAAAPPGPRGRRDPAIKDQKTSRALARVLEYRLRATASG